MPAVFPLRATLSLCYDALSTKRGYGGEDPYGICDKSKPTSVVYSAPFRRSFKSPIQTKQLKKHIYPLCLQISYPSDSAIVTCPLSV